MKDSSLYAVRVTRGKRVRYLRIPRKTDLSVSPWMNMESDGLDGATQVASINEAKSIRTTYVELLTRNSARPATGTEALSEPLGSITVAIIKIEVTAVLTTVYMNA